MKFWLKALGVAAILAVFLLKCSPAHAASQPVNFYGGANATWLQGPDAAWPVDAEIGGSASSSLSPHISAVGGVWYGFSHSYVRYSAAARITATDVNDPNFNIFLDAGVRGGSKAEVGPTEFAPGAGFGWRIAPTAYPRLLLVGDASYGTTSSRVLAFLGLRYLIPLK